MADYVENNVLETEEDVLSTFDPEEETNETVYPEIVEDDSLNPNSLPSTGKKLAIAGGAMLTGILLYKGIKKVQAFVEKKKAEPKKKFVFRKPWEFVVQEPEPAKTPDPAKEPEVKETVTPEVVETKEA